MKNASRLLAWCLMPNHVHVVIEMLDGLSLSEIVGSWKSFTAKRANHSQLRLCGTVGNTFRKNPYHFRILPRAFISADDVVVQRGFDVPAL